MTHLLHRLARRALNAERAVRPVTPPLFLPIRREPPMPAAGERPTASTAASAPRRPQWSTAAASDARRSPPESRPCSKDFETTTSSVAPPPAPPIQTRVDDPRLSERPVFREEVTRLPPTPDLARRIEPRATGPHASAQRSEAAVVYRSTDVQETVAAAPRDQKSEAPRNQLEPAQHSAPAATRPRMQRQQKATVSPATTIEVTIGRIEVRTQPPPARRPERKPREPAMSLDAYAAERKAGRR